MKKQNKNSSYKIFVAGSTGFLGKRVMRKLSILKMNYVGTSLSKGVDFRKQKELFDFMEQEKPNIIINCAAYIGGIKFGLEHEGEIYYNNTLMNTNLIEAARKYQIKRFINPISNCSYPDVIKKDFKENEWWDGPLHHTVVVYGFVKKATWIQSYAYHKQYGMDFINLIVPNMYGPGDYFDEERSHALGALIKKIVTAKLKRTPFVTVWGTGKPIREWLYVDDCVDLLIKSIDIEQHLNPINIGQGKGISIADLALMIKEIVGYKGTLVFDPSRPDGARYKVMNIDEMKRIFKRVSQTPLRKGILKTVKWYYENIN